MKKLTMVASLALVVALFAAPAFAFDVPLLKHHVTGSVMRIDNSTNTFTVTEDKTQKSYVFTAKDPGMLRAMSRGEHVRVAYAKHGTQLIASKAEPKSAERTAARQ